MSAIRTRRPTRFAASSALLLTAVTQASLGQDIFQTVNENLSPGPFFWGAPSGKIGWYWTPASDVELQGIQTRLASGFGNINNAFAFSTTLFTDRPAAGGVPLGTFDWRGDTPIDGPWLGGSFPTPITLTGGTRYFLGMSGWEQGLDVFGGSGGSGVNWIDPPDQPGAETLGAGSGFTGDDFEIQMNTGPTPANVDSPILRFLAVPAPSTAALLGLGGILVSSRRRR